VWCQGYLHPKCPWKSHFAAGTFTWGETDERMERGGWHFVRSDRPAKAICPDCWLVWIGGSIRRDVEVEDSAFVWATPHCRRPP
jgi:hypothetical protein